MNNELITVVIPTYNEKRELLKKAVDSILNQTYPYIELIVVDDGCTDGTSEWIQKNYGKDVRLFRRERTTNFRSVSEAFNIGLENARGRWWHHDAADCWHEFDWAERCMDFIDGREELFVIGKYVGIHTDFAVHKYDGSVEQVDVKKTWNMKASSLENYIHHEALGGMLFRMSTARKAGLWDVRFPRKQTREWTLRVLQYGDLIHVPRVLWHFVFHEPDQMKRKASVKYRVLADLKNGIDIEQNMKIAYGSEFGRYALLEACREFFTEPQWAIERENNITAKKIAEIKKECDEEASEE